VERQILAPSDKEDEGIPIYKNKNAKIAKITFMIILVYKIC